MTLQQILALRYIESARPLLIFDPKQAIDTDIAKASKRIAKYFGRIKKPSDVSKSSIESPLADLIKTAEVNGFMLGAHHTGRKPTLKWSSRVAASANKRAAEVDGTVKIATSKGLKTGAAYWLSGDRAAKIARYEATRSFYSGVLSAFSDTDYDKEWILHEAHGIDDDCDDADDDGPIGVDEEFSNGYMSPPSHINCQCTLGFRKTK
jgi:hypothetical protein